jgi:MFS family permease
MGIFPSGYKFLTGNILALSMVSMLADSSTEMLQPILPLFLVGTLDASYVTVGLIEGSSDTISSLVKVMAGSLSDRFGKRKPFVFVGYLPTAILKPLLYFVNIPLQVLPIRIAERLADFSVSFFILGAKSNGMAGTQVVLLHTLFNITYAAASYPFGALADRICRDKVVMIG